MNARSSLEFKQGEKTVRRVEITSGGEILFFAEGQNGWPDKPYFVGRWDKLAYEAFPVEHE